jgi:hypothetical protein
LSKCEERELSRGIKNDELILPVFLAVFIDIPPLINTNIIVTLSEAKGLIRPIILALLRFFASLRMTRISIRRGVRGEGSQCLPPQQNRQAERGKI